MNFKHFLPIIFLAFFTASHSQDKKPLFQLGFSTGFGSEFKNSDYTYTNQYYKLQIIYAFKKTKNFEFEIVVQPEINFATHQLLNLYFVQPFEDNFQQKRDEYTK
jgi:hypothetical protein